MIQALDQTEAMALLQALPLAVIATDQEKIIWISRQAEILVGLNAEALCGQPIESLPRWLRDIFSSGEEKDQLTGEPGCEVLATLQRVDGKRITRVCFLSDGREVKQLKGQVTALERQLGTVDTRDDSSGLLNQRGLLQVIESQVSRSRRYGNALSLISMQINDYGVAAREKEAVLTALGHFFNDRLRWVDSVGRLEGDEFIMVLPETKLESAITMVTKLTLELQTLNLDSNGTAVVLDAHFGTAAWCDGDDPSRLLLRCQADRKSLLVMNE